MFLGSGLSPGPWDVAPWKLHSSGGGTHGGGDGGRGQGKKGVVVRYGEKVVCGGGGGRSCCNWDGLERVGYDQSIYYDKDTAGEFVLLLSLINLLVLTNLK